MLSAVLRTSASAQVCDSYYTVGACESTDQSCAWGPQAYARYSYSCATGEAVSSIPTYWACWDPGCAGATLGIIDPWSCPTGIAPTEQCGNGIDDNYDGCVDETCVSGADQCTCESKCDGVTACAPQNQRPLATCKPFNGGAEICRDGIDNNCNGLVDESCGPPGPGPSPLNPNPPKQTCPGATSAGNDPIMLGSQSAVTEPFTDFKVDTGLVSVALTRTYTSNDWSYAGGPVGPFGRGWAHEWHGTVACTARKCTVALGGSGGWEFKLAGSALSLSGGETWDIYTAYSDATTRTGDNPNILVRRPGGEWILFSPDGFEHHFEGVCDTCSDPAADPVCRDARLGGQARLTRVVDPRGASARVEYDRPGGVLLRIVDDLGHSLELRSGSACTDGLASTLLYDGMTVVTYSYAGVDLLQATDADGSVLQSYFYDIAGTERLLAVANESGTAVAQFAYDAYGRAVGIVDRLSSVEVDYDAPDGIHVTE